MKSPAIQSSFWTITAQSVEDSVHLYFDPFRYIARALKLSRSRLSFGTWGEFLADLIPRLNRTKSDKTAESEAHDEPLDPGFYIQSPAAVPQHRTTTLNKQAGFRLQQIRERLGLSARQVEEASLEIADAQRNSDYVVSTARLMQIENGGSLPSIFKFCSLAVIYELSIEEIMREYGINLAKIDEHLKRRNQAELETRRGEQRLTYAEVPHESLEECIQRATTQLLSLQTPEGFWVGELEADTTLESDYIFLLHVLGKLDNRARVKLANYIRRRQLDDGGWNIYYGGPSELNATVKAYVALKLAGDSPGSSHMARARYQIHELGGVEATNSDTRFHLALGGMLPWSYVPAIPPELILIPSWFFLNIYSMSSWTRTVVVPLMIVYALKPNLDIPPNAYVGELFREAHGRIPGLEWDGRLVTWRNYFLVLDRLFKVHETLPWKPLRRWALHRAKQWLMEHLQRTDGLGAVYPAMVNSVFALRALGYSADDPRTLRELENLARLEIEESDTLRIQPCFSPVRDTAIAMFSLQEAGLPSDHPAIIRAATWLLGHQVLGGGDWQVNNPEVDPGGWAFEFRNDFYPDVADTVLALIALQRVAYPDPARLEQAMRCGTAWVLGMQNRDGGWGAFDRDNDSSFLTRVTFADHNAMIDPSTADLTALVLEYLGRSSWPVSDSRIQLALDFLRRDQTPEGAWFGRWGVNYLYGTSGVLRALESLGLGKQSESQRGAAWLRAVQNPDGGYGESCGSYDVPELKARGKSTASQTAWALIGLLAAGEISEPAVKDAVGYLLNQQRENGTWTEAAFTGTGFPRTFYLKHHLYPNIFPLYALTKYRNLLYGAPEFEVLRFSQEQFPRQKVNKRT